jgi:CRISPR-associated endonuclease/helicase Cas3
LVAVGWLDLTKSQQEMVAAGVATHHYDLLEILERYPYGSEARTKLLGELLQEDWDAIRKWLCGGGAPDVTRWGFGSLPALRQLTPDQALTESMRTLVSFRERLEQYDATDRKALAARAMRGLVTLADHAGSAHERHGRAPSLESEQRLSQHLEKSGWSFFWPHQRACAEIDGHALLIAPTGSGKTEAALLWAARQRGVHLVSDRSSTCCLIELA